MAIWIRELRAAVVFVGLGCGPSSEVGDGSSSASATAAESGGDESTGAGACGDPNSCRLFSPCQSCGGATSPFDVDGCVRPQCSADAECAAGERCYVGRDFDSCVPSMVTCEDDVATMTCNCTQSNDCEGAYCIPEHDYPMVHAGPIGTPEIASDCGPADGVITRFHIYGEGAATECIDDRGMFTTLELEFYDPDADGVYRFEQMSGNGAGYYAPDADNTIQIRQATLTVNTDDGGHASGEYTFVVTYLDLYGASFTDAAVCPLEGPCG